MEEFGRYVLLERIACGGMAEVFRAAAVGSAGFAKTVAIKRVLPHLSMEQAFVSMLIDEAKIASTLIHPNILQVLDLGQANGSYFIAMEFLVGKTLEQVVNRAAALGERLPHDFCAFVIKEALQGLFYAHNKADSFGNPLGLIHRDISPQNIMLGYDGGVKLTDFGIARAAQRSTHTVAGNVKGKPAYMTPEGITGRQIDQRVDIYAMGVVLHELLCMRAMREGDTDAQLLLDVAEGRYPTFEQRGVQVPGELATIVYKALAPIVDNRWPDAMSFATALDELIRKQGWHHDSAQVSVLMRRWFAEEIVKEKEAQRHDALALQGRVRTEPGFPAPQADGGPASSWPTTPPSQPSQPRLAPLPSPFTPNTMPQFGATPQPHPVVVATPPGMRTTNPHIHLADIEPERPLLLTAKDIKRSRVLPWLLTLMVVGGGLGGGAYWYLVQHKGLGVKSLLPALMPAELIVESVPAGAQVLINGQPHPTRTPATVGGLPPGPVQIEVSLPGMETIKESRVLNAGDKQRMTLKLQAVPASSSGSK